MMRKVRLKSPAKVNLSLEILKKRQDGYHEIRTMLQKISLYDILNFSLEKEKGIFIETDHPSLPIGRDNLVYKAAESILKRIKYNGGVRIRIEKRIPIGSGLGGGSSNAASTLKALNKIFKLGMSDKALMKIGREIGADVPFFLFDGSAIGFGIGDKLKGIEIPHLWYILIYPNFEVSTRWAYKNFLLTKNQFHLKLHTFLKYIYNIPSILRNDLEGVVSKEYPEIEIMKRALLDVGALGSSMTGSGPTVFGIFDSKRDIKKALEKLNIDFKERGWTIIEAHGIN